ncbi:hypothetical protein [Streptomyces iconiensis]|uniref:Integral membrane protein n=1 Tax=Streptomyces iconiensis TaxID=1384038 RepID=A0ABT7A2A1_9ACTN|nr:hypothetical protein [Streptomyces iconiensis]MDJ1135192.1 hypothetical protein [Streptomyces iconiensis]
MIVTLIIICEIAFWVLLAGGLALRYLARMPRTGAAVLLCEPLLEVVLLIVTAIDLKNGAEPDWKHGLAAVYIGFTATHGHYVVKWADGHAAHRFGGAGRPVKPPRYGMPRALHEWKMTARFAGAAAIAAALLQCATWYVGDPSQTEGLRQWQGRMGLLTVISVIIALSYTLWPKQPKEGEEPMEPMEPMERMESAERTGATGRKASAGSAESVERKRLGGGESSADGSAADRGEDVTKTLR